MLVLLSSFTTATFTDIIAKVGQEQVEPRITSMISSNEDLKPVLGAYNMITALGRDPVYFAKSTAMQQACNGGVKDMQEACKGLTTAQSVYTTISGLKNMNTMSLACGTGGSLVSSLGQVCSQYDMLYSQAQQYTGIAKDPTGTGKALAESKMMELKSQMMLMLTEKIVPGKVKQIMPYVQMAKGYVDAWSREITTNQKKKLKKPALVSNGSTTAIPRRYKNAKSCFTGLNFNLRARDAAKGVGVGDIENCIINTKGKATMIGKYEKKTRYVGKGFLISGKKDSFKRNFISIDGTVLIERKNGYTYLTVAGKDTKIRTYKSGWVLDKQSLKDKDNELTQGLMGNSYLILNGTRLYKADLSFGKSFDYIEYDKFGKMTSGPGKSSSKKKVKILIAGKYYTIPRGGRLQFLKGVITIDTKYASLKEFGIDGIGTVTQLTDEKVDVKRMLDGSYRITGTAKFVSDTGASFNLKGSMIYRKDNDFSVLGSSSTAGVLYKKGNDVFYVGGEKDWLRVTQCSRDNIDVQSQRIDYCHSRGSVIIRAGSDKAMAFIVPFDKVDPKSRKVSDVVKQLRSVCNEHRQAGEIKQFDCDSISPEKDGSVLIPGNVYWVNKGKSFKAVIGKNSKTITGEVEMGNPFSSDRMTVRGGKAYSHGKFTDLMKDGKHLLAKNTFLPVSDIPASYITKSEIDDCVDISASANEKLKEVFARACFNIKYDEVKKDYESNVLVSRTLPKRVHNLAANKDNLRYNTVVKGPICYPKSLMSFNKLHNLCSTTFGKEDIDYFKGTPVVSLCQKSGNKCVGSASSL